MEPPEQPYSEEEALKHIVRIQRLHTAYPQGKPVDVTVTLTDERWNAVTLGVKMTLVAHFSEGASILPDWLVTQMMEALSVISDLNAEGVAAQEVDKLIEEIRNAQEGSE